MAIKNKYSDIDLSKYAKGYQASKQVKDAQKLKTQAEKAVRNYGDFKYGNQGAYDKAMNAILNRKSFSYDLNGDALYQQYKDMYMSQGKLAMADTMGQAAALTGGYGNSYAASVGNQAYQGYLQQLNGVIPELYNLALSAYNAEGDRLNNNFNLLSTDRSTEYGEYTDKYNRLVNDRGYYSDNYNNVYNQDYSKWTDNRNYDQSQYWNEYNAGYQKDRDAIADAQWQKEYNLAVSKANSSASAKNTGGVSGVPSAVIDGIKKCENDVELNNYLLKKEDEGVIEPGQSKALFKLYSKGDDTTGYVADDDGYLTYEGDKPLSERNWTVTNDGGYNVGWGVDNNAVLTDKAGNDYTAKDLYKQLQNEMSKEDAKKFLEKYGVWSPFGG